MNKLVAKKRRVSGLRLFKLDTKTGMVTDLGLDRCLVDIEPGCVYRQALNRKNFVKILLREGIISITSQSTTKKEQQ
jgi:hypothetical protein